MEAQNNISKKLEVWGYPDPLEKPLTYAKFDEQSDHDDYYLSDDDNVSEWRIKKQQSDPSTRRKCGSISPG